VVAGLGGVLIVGRRFYHSVARLAA